MQRRVAQRTRYRDRVIVKTNRSAENLLSQAETKTNEINETLQSERTRFRRELAERDHKIELLELEIKGLVGINTRYNQLVERDLAIFSRQIEESKSSVAPPAAYG